MSGLYTTNAPDRLFKRRVKPFSQFYEFPSEDGIFDVVFPLYHLREWICPGGYRFYKDKALEGRSREETLHALLHEMPEYQVIRDLCNNAKHFDASDLSTRTEVR